MKITSSFFSDEFQSIRNGLSSATSVAVNDPSLDSSLNSYSLRRRSRWDYFMWTMERQGIAVLVLLDLSAAFGAIDHNVLLARMKNCSSIPLKWFTSYLSGRTQRLHINNQFSQPRELLSGVPQGSILGPLLFFDIHSSS